MNPRLASLGRPPCPCTPLLPATIHHLVNSAQSGHAPAKATGLPRRCARDVACNGLSRSFAQGPSPQTNVARPLVLTATLGGCQVGMDQSGVSSNIDGQHPYAPPPPITQGSHEAMKSQEPRTAVNTLCALLSPCQDSSQWNRREVPSPASVDSRSRFWWARTRVIAKLTDVFRKLCGSTRKQSVNPSEKL